MKTYNVAVIGATDLVGQEIVAVLEKRDFQVNDLQLFASEHTAGAKITYRDEELVVQRLRETSFDGVDLGFFAAGAAVSQQFVPYALNAGAMAIDLSSAFRLQPDVPLIIPEVNPEAIAAHRGILACPGSVTIQLVVVLKPIHEAVGIKRIVVSTYQAVSETGKDAIEELDKQVRQIFNHRDILCQVYPHQIAFNCLPQVGGFLDNGATQAESNLVQETKKILDDESIGITATAVYVPLFYGHSAAVNIETEIPITPEGVRTLLANAPGVKVLDEPPKNIYPYPVEAAGEDEILVGRIRADDSVENGLNLWIVADNIRKGAALNAIQIAEQLIAL
jgi:aspartate-semialdehyde dehydrogenase